MFYKHYRKQKIEEKQNEELKNEEEIKKSTIPEIKLPKLPEYSKHCFNINEIDEKLINFPSQPPKIVEENIQAKIKQLVFPHSKRSSFNESNYIKSPFSLCNSQVT